MREDEADDVYVEKLHEGVCVGCAARDTWDYRELTRINLSAHVEASLTAAGNVNDVHGHADGLAAWLEHRHPVVRQEPASNGRFDCEITTGNVTRIAESELSPRAEEVKIDRRKMIERTGPAASKTLFVRELSFKQRDRHLEDTRKASIGDDALWVLNRNHLAKRAKIATSVVRTTAFRDGIVVFDAERNVGCADA